ncbi:hypothetical protein [Nocardioides sp.]|uniref:hypothetical protein n=1 Tax=Nocardioides sp. TaxID=35761 RepID=UPI0039E3FFEC
MAERLVLHIGTMKTGTSFVQSVLMRSAAAHDAAGFHYVGDFQRQTQAVRRVLAAPKSPPKQADWRALVEEARAWPGSTAIVSMEFLSFARPHQIEAFLAPLDGLEVQVVATVRDQAAAIPAQWQSYCRLFGTDSWPAYLARIDPARQQPGDADTRAATAFNRAQDVVAILERWGGVVGAIDVVTVPRPGAPRDELWKRFTAAIGMPWDLADLEDHFPNVSLGFASADVLRRLNRHLQGHPAHIYRPGLRPLVRDAFFPRRDAEGRPALDQGGIAFAARRNQAIRDAMAGHRVTGSVDDLPVPTPPPAAPEVAAGPPKKQVKGAADALWHRCAVEFDIVKKPPMRLEKTLRQIADMLPRTHGWQEALEERGLHR